MKQESSVLLSMLLAHFKIKAAIEQGNGAVQIHGFLILQIGQSGGTRRLSDILTVSNNATA
jgi:hypothetical protein